MTLSLTGARPKPALDEKSFQELLAAAYVVQQHTETLRLPDSDPTPGPARVLTVIAEIQSLIRTRGLDVPASAALIAERARELTGASGVSIGVVSEGYLQCVGESGEVANIPGRCISSHSLVATERLKAGGMFESGHSPSDMRLDMDLCRRLGVGSLIAAAILRFGEIAGVIEARWQREKGFTESDLRTCRLLAGLLTGTLERSVRIGNARAAVSDTTDTGAAPLDVEAPARAPSEATATALPPTPDASEPAPAAMAHEPSAEAPLETPAQLPVPTCRMCGRPFAGDETFCGFCSMPRPAEESSAGLQSKWASMWFMQRAQGAMQEVPDPAADVTASTPLPKQELAPATVIEAEVRIPRPGPTPLTRVLQTRAANDDFYASIRSRPELEAPRHQAPAATFPFAEQSPISKRVAHAARNHWRNAILASVALTLAFGLATAWPKVHSRPTWFQVAMVRLGVMNAAVVSPSFSGRADAQVWVDSHTQLYYCQGEDLYGKTPDGEFTNQHNAQSDGFQSASNVACP